MTSAEQLALWADKLRDLAALGLRYSDDVYNRDRYTGVQTIAMEMLALANGQSVESLEPLRAILFARPSPLTVGAAAIIDDTGRILLARRSDNEKWNMPGGMFEVGETPAEAVAREVREETGWACEPVALVGVYDSRIWDKGLNSPYHQYKFTFLCKPIGDQPVDPHPSHALETLETHWFTDDTLPENLMPGHLRRIQDSYRVWRGDMRAHFDF